MAGSAWQFTQTCLLPLHSGDAILQGNESAVHAGMVVAGAGDVNGDEHGALGSVICFADDDSDGFGDADTAMAACICPSGYVNNTLD